MAIGEDTLHRFMKCLPSPLQVTTEPQEHRFRSVNGTTATSHVASIPVAVGEKGGFLRPAVFTGPTCRQAPFLISLPFLIFCQTTLTLDAQRGLHATFARLGFGVPCHIGPTGALRIQPGNFTPEQRHRLVEAQRSFRRGSEFEVLKTTVATPTIDESNGAIDQEDPRGGTQPGQVHVGTTRSEAALHGSPDQSYGGQARPATGEPRHSGASQPDRWR